MFGFVFVCLGTPSGENLKQFYSTISLAGRKLTAFDKDNKRQRERHSLLAPPTLYETDILASIYSISSSFFFSSPSAMDVCSLNEKKFEKFAKARPRDLAAFHQQYLSRIYPSGKVTL